MATYTFKQLENISQSIKLALKQDLNKSERFMFLKNQKICSSELNKLREYLLDNVEDFVTFQNERFKLMVDAGAQVEPTGDGGQRITDFSGVEDWDKLEKDLKELAEKYKDTIEEQGEINKENESIMNEREVEVEWYTVDFDALGDQTNDQILNENTLDFIDA